MSSRAAVPFVPRPEKWLAGLLVPLSCIAGVAGGALADPSGSWLAAGRWAKLSFEGAYGHSCVYDPVRDRLVLFGGFDAALDEVGPWSFPCAGPPTWARIPAPGPCPGRRYGHSAIYDPAGDRMLIFGGLEPDAYGDRELAETWALSLADGGTWERLVITGGPPPPRSGHSAVYDPVGHRMLVYGGRGQDSMLDDVWALSLSGEPQWTRLTPVGTAPAARSGHSAIYDSARGRMVVFGGEAPGDARNDAWALTLGPIAAWLPLAPTGTPPAVRSRHAAAYDPVRDRMLIFGGERRSASRYYYDDAWGLSLEGDGQWVRLDPGLVGPSARSELRGVYDTARDRFVVVGGAHTVGTHFPTKTVFEDVWALAAVGDATWERLDVSGRFPEPGLHTAAMVEDPVRRRLLVIGGLDSTGIHRNDVWSCPATTASPWEALNPTGTPPPPRAWHVAVYDPTGDRVIMFGGQDASSFLNDVWALELSPIPSWIPMDPSGTPPTPRLGAGAVFDSIGGRVVVYGGSGAAGASNEVWELALAGGPAWGLLTPAGAPPPPRHLFRTAHDRLRNRMLVFGGLTDALAGLHDVWALSLSGPMTWEELAASGIPPSPRDGSSAVYDPHRDRLLVFGGYPDSNDAWALSLSGDPTWAPLRPAGDWPRPREYHAAVYSAAHDRTLVFGGYADAPTPPMALGDLWGLDFSAGGVGVGRPGPARPLAGEPVGARPVARGSQRATGGLEVRGGARRVAIEFHLPARSRASLVVHDLAGRAVRTLAAGTFEAGRRALTWDRKDADGRAVPGGIYFASLVTDEMRITRKMVVLP